MSGSLSSPSPPLLSPPPFPNLWKTLPLLLPPGEYSVSGLLSRRGKIPIAKLAPYPTPPFFILLIIIISCVGIPITVTITVCWNSALCCHVTFSFRNFNNYSSNRRILTSVTFSAEPSPSLRPHPKSSAFVVWCVNPNWQQLYPLSTSSKSRSKLLLGSGLAKWITKCSLSSTFAVWFGLRRYCSCCCCRCCCCCC